jgi:hypothetical protein
MKIARNRLSLATGVFDGCLETATVCPTANALHESVNFVRRCMHFVQPRVEIRPAAMGVEAGKI